LKATSDLEAFFGAYGLVVIDECHHLPAFSFESAVKRAPSQYFLGMTATPYRRDGLQDIITMQCGPIRHQITDRQADGRSELTLQLGVRETPVTLSDMSEETPIQQLLGALTLEGDRNAIVCDDVFRALADGRRCLVLSQRKEHCRVLARSLAEMGKAPLMLDGGATKKARVAMLETIQNRPREEELLVIATGQYLGEGFDCPQLDTLFLAFPVSFKGKLVQYTGRLMRQCKGKTVVQVYDYADTRVPVLKRMFEKRMKTYRALGFLEKDSGRA
jgi:superfamily II DNA or RNA helicase